ncbi:cas scaffolding protein family member 4 isoform X2 [Sphaerodactylus townsendi]|uniref:cas scaffolding protein family member 4 isoform X2 n=1 Tax=Sphaerodactylus townsendi TaxID=933632 RepID=UPI00202615E6|nr:cas scaffolding protein family member 4 isoform X2 [Sphaerodactylus townsendi]
MDRNHGPFIFIKNALAKALYDNKAECPDELAFRRGDILTVLEQDPFGNKGWWKCSHLGKQGLAPANRLQLLVPSQASSALHDSQGLQTAPGTIYQIPSKHKSPSRAAPVYERMDSWIKPRSSSVPNQETYQVPALAARLLSEKAQSSSNQHLFTLPRASWAFALANRSDIYDVPSPQRHRALFSQGLATPPSSRKGSQVLHSAENCLEESPRLYNVPLNVQKTSICTQEPAVSNVYDILPTASRDPGKAIEAGKHLSHYNTLPNLRKSDWIYDIPEKTGLKQTPQGQSSNKHMFYDIPPSRLESDTQKFPPINSGCQSTNPQLYDVPPVQRKLSLQESPLYDVPSTHDVLVVRQNRNYHVLPAAVSSRTEKEDQQQTLYDVPKRIASPQQNGVKKCSYNSRDISNFSSHSPRDAKSNQDRLSVSSVESRTSTISTSSSASTESFSSSPSSSSDEPSKQPTMELETAIETLTQLQHSVSSSIASLMIFVSSRWRYQEHLEGNIEEIHRAVDHIKVSLGEFLDFAHTIEENAAWASDSKLRVRITKQLSILTASFQILVEMREALNKCAWSLEVLVIQKPQSSPDDLDRFVMVARTIPDDIKRFVSIVIANGKLLFRKTCRETNGKEPRRRMAKDSLERRREDNSLLRNVLDKSKENSLNVERARAEVTEDCDYVQILGSPSQMEPNVLSKQDPAKKMELSDLCRLYFGAVQKAIGVLQDSLNRNQAPESFIAHSKLVIMVGQKLVDALCQEALEKTTRNEVLCYSSKFCSLLKTVAVATKNAAMQYPSAEATRELQYQADGLSKYTQQFQAMIE